MIQGNMAEVQEERRLAALHTCLRQKMLSLMPEDGDYGSILLHGFTATRRSKAETAEFEYRPVIGLVVQGTRLLQVGYESSCCKAGECFIGGPEVTKASSFAASVKAPYLSLSLDLEKNLAPGDNHIGLIQGAFPGQAAFKADLALFDAFFRLLTLTAKPEHFFYLGPLLVREIYFRLSNPNGKLFDQINLMQKQ